MPGILRCCATLVAGKCHANGRRRFEPTRDLDTRRQHERSTLCRLLALDDLFSYSPWVQSSESSAEYGLIDLCRVLSFPLFFSPKGEGSLPSARASGGGGGGGGGGSSSAVRLSSSTAGPAQV